MSEQVQKIYGLTLLSTLRVVGGIYLVANHTAVILAKRNCTSLYQFGRVWTNLINLQVYTDFDNVRQV